MSTGIDIGSKSIKIVELFRSGQSLVLRAAGAVTYQGNSPDKINDDKDLSNFGQTVKKLASDAKVSSKKVVLSIPETQVFTRLMKFPLLNNEEIESAVKWEAEEYIPIPLKDAILRHTILDRQETGTPPQVLVQVVAVAKSVVDKYIGIVEEAGFEVTALETELMATSRALGVEGKTSLIIDIGAQSTNIAIAKGTQLFLSRSIPTAGEAFTRAVSLSLGVTPQQAEQYKVTYGLSQNQLEGKVALALSPVVRLIADEIKKAVHYFQVDCRQEAPTAILLSGGSAGLPGLSVELAKVMGSEVVVANPFTGHGLQLDPDSAKSLVNFAPLYTVAVGLAEREE